MSLIPSIAQDTDVVSFKVFVNDAELNNEVSLTQLVVNKTFNKIAFAKIVLLDGSLSERDFPLSNEDTFKPGNRIRIDLGYDGDNETVFEGIIVKHGIKTRQNGSSMLLVEAKDKAIKLTAGRKSKYYLNTKDSDAITSLAGDLATDVQPTGLQHKQLVQFDSTDWDFIVTRAEANGMLVLTDDGKLVVKKPSDAGSPVLTATYGQNIIEFEAEMDARRQLARVTSQSWDFTHQQLESSNPGTAQFSGTGNIATTEIGQVLDADLKLSHSGHLTQSQLQVWADAYALRNAITKVAGRVRVEGNASVKPGTIIELDGVGDRFNGNVFVTGVLHQYDGEWHTDIQFGWKEDWFYTKEKVMDQPASGLLPGVNGLQVGIVKDVNDAEQGGQYRVKVHVPLFSNDEGIWARVATIAAGDNYGSYFRPQTNDEVILGFVNDDPREAVILGYLHSKDVRKSALPDSDGQLQNGFVTKQGMKLVFNDSNKSIRLSVKLNGSQEKFIVINDSGAIELKDENQNSIKMDGSGITIQAGTGKNVTIKGTKVLIN